MREMFEKTIFGQLHGHLFGICDWNGSKRHPLLGLQIGRHCGILWRIFSLIHFLNDLSSQHPFYYGSFYGHSHYSYVQYLFGKCNWLWYFVCIFLNQFNNVQRFFLSSFGFSFHCNGADHWLNTHRILANIYVIQCALWHSQVFSAKSLHRPMIVKNLFLFSHQIRSVPKSQTNADCVVGKQALRSRIL